MAEDRGVTVRWAEIHEADCTLDMADLASKINFKHQAGRRRLRVECRRHHQSRKEIVRLAHAAGALGYLDAVHYGPHGLIDVALSTAISWPARLINSSARTWACSTANANT